jgi:O-antigen/teichoic acid export membrane protein
MLVIAFGRALQVLLTLATVRVASTLLATEEMGRLALFLAATTFFSSLLINPVGMFVNRRIHAWAESGRVPEYLRTYVYYLLFVSVVVSGLLLTVQSASLIDFHTRSAWLIVLVVGSLLMGTVNQTAIPSLNLIGFRNQYVLLTIITATASFSFATILASSVRPSAEWWLVGLILGQSIVGIVGWRLLMQRVNRFPVAISHANLRPQLSVLLAFAWPLALSASLLWGQTQAHRFLLDSALGLQLLGLFAAGYSISAGILNAFESVITTYLQPKYYSRVNRLGEIHYAPAWNEYASAVLPSLLLTVSWIFAVAPELTQLLLASRYHAATPFILWGACAEAARVTIGVYAMAAQAKMKTRMMILPNLIGALLALGLVWGLVGKMGLNGAGLALTVAGFGSVLVIHYLIKNQLPVSLAWARLGYAFIGGVVLVVGTYLVRDMSVTMTLSHKLTFVVAASCLYLVLQVHMLGRHLKN